MSAPLPAPPALPATLQRALAGLRDVELRAVRDDDDDGLIALVGAAFAEHPGCVLDLPGLDADLVTPATTAAAKGTALWVLDHDGRIIASVGAGPVTADGVVELKRLYVAASHRRQGIARGLVAVVEARARMLGAHTVELWSDTRFTAAHRMYEGLGYVHTGRTRHLDDPSDTTEYHYERRLPAG